MCFSVGVPITPLTFDIWPQYSIYKADVSNYCALSGSKRLDDKQRILSCYGIGYLNPTVRPDLYSVVLLAPLSTLPYYWQLTVLATLYVLVFSLVLKLSYIPRTRWHCSLLRVLACSWLFRSWMILLMILSENDSLPLWWCTWWCTVLYSHKGSFSKHLFCAHGE